MLFVKKLIFFNLIIYTSMFGSTNLVVYKEQIKAMIIHSQRYQQKKIMGSSVFQINEESKWKNKMYGDVAQYSMKSCFGDTPDQHIHFFEQWRKKYHNDYCNNRKRLLCKVKYHDNGFLNEKYLYGDKYDSLAINQNSEGIYQSSRKLLQALKKEKKEIRNEFTNAISKLIPYFDRLPKDVQNVLILSIIHCLSGDFIRRHSSQDLLNCLNFLCKEQASLIRKTALGIAFEIFCLNFDNLYSELLGLFLYQSHEVAAPFFYIYLSLLHKHSISLWYTSCDGSSNVSKLLNLINQVLKNDSDNNEFKKKNKKMFSTLFCFLVFSSLVEMLYDDEVIKSKQDALWKKFFDFKQVFEERCYKLLKEKIFYCDIYDLNSLEKTINKLKIEETLMDIMRCLVLPAIVVESRRYKLLSIFLATKMNKNCNFRKPVKWYLQGLHERKYGNPYTVYDLKGSFLLYNRQSEKYEKVSFKKLMQCSWGSLYV